MLVLTVSGALGSFFKSARDSLGTGILEYFLNDDFKYKELVFDDCHGIVKFFVIFDQFCIISVPHIENGDANSFF